MKKEQMSGNTTILGGDNTVAWIASQSGGAVRRDNWDQLTQEERGTVLWFESCYWELTRALVACGRLAEATGNHPRFVRGGEAIASMLRFLKDFKPSDADLTDSSSDSVPADSPVLAALARHGL